MSQTQIIGKISVTINGRHYIHQFNERSNFANYLLKVMQQEENPAAALAFLSEFAISTYYPDDFRQMRFVKKWTGLFGHPKR